MIEFDPSLEHDPVLDRPPALNLRDYLGNFKRTKEMFAWLWAELISTKGRRLLFWMLLPMLVVCFIGILIPFSIKMIFDGLAQSLVQHDGFNSKIIRGTVQCGILWIISEVFQTIKRSIREYLFDENSRRQRYRVNTLFFEKALGEHIVENRLLSESNIKKGYERIEAQQKLLLFEGIETVINMFLAYGAIWYISWLLKSWTLGLAITGMFLAYAAWSLFLNNKVMEACLPLNKRWNFLSRYQSERWRHVQRVVTNAREEEEIEDINNYYDRTIKEDIGFWLWFIRQISYRAVANQLMMVGVIIYGTWQVVKTKLTIGDFYPILNYTFKLIDGLNKLSDLEHQINYWSPSVMALKRALTKPLPLSRSVQPIFLNPETVACRVVFDRVGYGFPNKRKAEGWTGPPVLYNVSFTIEPGEKVALIGQSGSGKTTLMQLLLRFMDPTSGRITIDGCDLREIDHHSWMRLVGYIPQEPMIFSGTLRANLLYGLPNKEAEKVSDAELWEVVKTLQLDLGERLEDGLDTQLGHYGIDLSGGQKQRLMIAAAAMKRPCFMVIDEATSSLDASTEKLVQHGLERVLGRDIGALIVTHRLPTVRHLCDKFVLVQQLNGHGGEVVAIASSFEELAEKSTLFRQLAKDHGLVF